MRVVIAFLAGWMLLAQQVESGAFQVDRVWTTRLSESSSSIYVRANARARYKGTPSFYDSHALLQTLITDKRDGPAEGGF